MSDIGVKGKFIFFYLCDYMFLVLFFYWKNGYEILIFFYFRVKWRELCEKYFLMEIVIYIEVCFGWVIVVIVFYRFFVNLGDIGFLIII